MTLSAYTCEIYICADPPWRSRGRRPIYLYSFVFHHLRCKRDESPFARRGSIFHLTLTGNKKCGALLISCAKAFYLIPTQEQKIPKLLTRSNYGLSFKSARRSRGVLARVKMNDVHARNSRARASAASVRVLYLKDILSALITALLNVHREAEFSLGALTQIRLVWH